MMAEERKGVKTHKGGNQKAKLNPVRAGRTAKRTR